MRRLHVALSIALATGLSLVSAAVALADAAGGSFPH